MKIKGKKAFRCFLAVFELLVLIIGEIFLFPFLFNTESTLFVILSYLTLPLAVYAAYAIIARTARKLSEMEQYEN